MPLWWDELSQPATARLYIPRLSFNCLLPLQDILQYQQVGLIHGLFKVLLLLRVSEYVRFLCALYETDLHFPALFLPWKYVSLAFKVRHSGGLTFMLWDPMWSLGLSLLGRSSAIIVILLLIDRLPGGVGLDCTMSSPLLSHLPVVLPLYL